MDEEAKMARRMDKAAKVAAAKQRLAENAQEANKVMLDAARMLRAAARHIQAAAEQDGKSASRYLKHLNAAKAAITAAGARIPGGLD